MIVASRLQVSNATFEMQYRIRMIMLIKLNKYPNMPNTLITDPFAKDQNMVPVVSANKFVLVIQMSML